MYKFIVLNVFVMTAIITVVIL